MMNDIICACGDVVPACNIVVLSNGLGGCVSCLIEEQQV